MIAAAKPGQPHQPAFRKKMILIVDDDETVASFFNMLLKEDGYHTMVVHSGQDALTKLKAKAPQKIDLLILDLMMPAPGGYEILKRLQDGDHQEVPVFVVTARDLDPGTVAQFKLESNLKGVWKKPIDQDEFKKQVQEVTGAAQRN